MQVPVTGDHLDAPPIGDTGSPGHDEAPVMAGDGGSELPDCVLKLQDVKLVPEETQLGL